MTTKTEAAVKLAELIRENRDRIKHADDMDINTWFEIRDALDAYRNAPEGADRVIRRVPCQHIDPVDGHCGALGVGLKGMCAMGDAHQHGCRIPWETSDAPEGKSVEVYSHAQVIGDGWVKLACDTDSLRGLGKNAKVKLTIHFQALETVEMG